jgi:hypothetical protein
MKCVKPAAQGVGTLCAFVVCGASVAALTAACGIKGRHWNETEQAGQGRNHSAPYGRGGMPFKHIFYNHVPKVKHR